MSTIRFLFSIGLLTMVIEAAMKVATSVMLSAFRETPDRIPLVAKILFTLQYWLVASVIVIAAYDSTPVSTPIAINLSIGFVVFASLLFGAYGRIRAQATEDYSEMALSMVKFQQYLLWGGLGYYLLSAYNPKLAYNSVTVGSAKFSYWLLDIPIIGWFVALFTLFATLSLVWSGLVIVFAFGSTFLTKSRS